MTLCPNEAPSPHTEKTTKHCQRCEWKVCLVCGCTTDPKRKTWLKGKQ